MRNRRRRRGREEYLLSELKPGQRARIMGYREDGPICRRLIEMGLVPGKEINYLRNAPLKDPLELQIGYSCLSIRHTEASLIIIQLKK